jgi:hypothetical protein
LWLTNDILLYTVYSNTYGCKRAIDAETGIIEREEQIKALEKEQKQLQQKKNELEHKMMVS